MWMTIYRMCVSIYISIYPLTYVRMLAYLYLPIYQYLSIHLPTYLIYLLISICPSIHPSIYFVCPFIYLSIQPPIYAVYLSINLCVLSLRKKPIFKFMPPFLLHLSLTFYREWNTVAEIPLWVSAHRVLWNSCISIFSLSLSLLCCMVCGILAPRPEIEPGPSAVRVWSPNHCTAKEFPSFPLFFEKNKNKKILKSIENL